MACFATRVMISSKNCRRLYEIARKVDAIVVNAASPTGLNGILT